MMKRSTLLVWTFLRLPLLAAGLYLLRTPILDFLKTQIELRDLIDFAIYSANTLETRLELFTAAACALGFGYWLIKRWMASEAQGYILFLTGSLASVFISFRYLLLTPHSGLRTGIVAVILALNTLPTGWLAKRLSNRRWMSLVFVPLVGWSEAVVPQAYLLWLLEKFQIRSSIKAWTWLAGIFAAPLIWVFVLIPYNNQRILTLGEILHASPAVEKFASGAYNWIEFDPDLDRIFVVGHGTNYLLAFDTKHLNVPPRKSEDIGKMQSFAYDPVRHEIYAYEAQKKALHYIDAISLLTTRSIPVEDLSPGDVWVNWQPNTNTMTIASEADYELGSPFVLIDRESGTTLASLPLPWIPTNVTFHTQKDVMYFNSFKDTYLVAWDLNSQEMLARVETRPSTDRLLFNPLTSEVLVASTLDGEILRYDSGTLEYKGSLDVSIGDRTLTLDTERNLLLVGNFINNRLQVIDLNSQDRIARYYIGPWIRTIALDMQQGIAYVSTVRNLFKVQYAPPLDE